MEGLIVGTVARDDICQIFLRYFEIILYCHVHRPAGNQDVMNSNIKQSCESNFIAFCLRVGITGTVSLHVQFYWKILRYLIEVGRYFSRYVYRIIKIAKLYTLRL